MAFVKTLAAVARGGFVRAVVRVASAASLVAWIVSVIASDDHHPLNFWLVIALGMLVLALFLWGLERSESGQPRVQEQHVYNAPVTFNIGGLSTTSREAAAEGTPDEYRIVHPWDLIDLGARDAPIIRGRSFRYVEITGPALVMFVGEVEIINTSFGAVEGDLDSLIWPWPDPKAKPKLGLYAFENCRFENCRFESIGFTGDPRVFDAIRQGLG